MFHKCSKQELYTLSIVHQWRGWGDYLYMLWSRSVGGVMIYTYCMSSVMSRASSLRSYCPARTLRPLSTMVTFTLGRAVSGSDGISPIVLRVFWVIKCNTHATYKLVFKYFCLVVISLFICLFVHLFIYTSACIFIYLLNYFIYLFIYWLFCCWFLCLIIFFPLWFIHVLSYLFMYFILYIFLFIYSFRLNIYSFTCLFTYSYRPIHLFTYVFIYLYIHLFIIFYFFKFHLFIHYLETPNLH